MVEPKGAILPIYFVADESGSMGRNIGELNEGLASLHDALQRESFAAAKVRLSVIGFSDAAFTYLEPADLRFLQRMPKLAAQGRTSFAAAFEQLAYRIRVDIPRFKTQGYSVHRPAVFFFTDGLPDRRGLARGARQAAEPARRPQHSGVWDRGCRSGDSAGNRHQTRFRVRGCARRGHRRSDHGIHYLPNPIGDQFRQALASGSAELQFEKPEGFTLAVDRLSATYPHGLVPPVEKQVFS